MQAMDFQTFASRRLNTKPASEGGWNLAHTTNTVPDQGNPLSNPFLVALGPPASAWGWPTDPRTEELRLKFATAAEAAARKAIADEYLRRIPKAELHCHLAGTLRATTVAELAQRAGLALPRPADKLYQWPDFYGFLDVLRLTALVLRTPGDFARAVYEYVEDAVRDGNLKHV